MTDQQTSMFEDKGASLFDALLPIAFLIIGLFLSVRFFGEDSSYGPNQIILLFSGCLALIVGLKNGQRWSDMETGVYGGMTVVFAPSFILLAVGIMIATWIAGGVVPTMIYFGLRLLSPDIFYAAACLVCAIVSLSIGSSWTTAASVGVAMIGTAAGLGLSSAICAGAIISGAYFGDKMSPLSDTTNLAPAVAGVDLFTHIRHMTWTSIPALAIALLLFTILGLLAEPSTDRNDLENMMAVLDANFTIAWYILLPLVLLFILAWKKVPAMPAILIAALTGILFAWIFQTPAVSTDASASTGSRLQVIWTLMFAGYEAGTGDAVLDDLLSGGGAANMLNTIWLMLCAIFFGGAMEQTGLLVKLIREIMKWATTSATIIASAVFTCIGANIITADQYMAIVIPGRMYKVAFRHHNMAPVNLSRVIEDAGTVTSPLVPWNTCGAYMAASLGVPTMVYLPFCFFNLLMPLIAILYGVIYFKILPLDENLVAE